MHTWLVPRRLMNWRPWGAVVLAVLLSCLMLANAFAQTSHNIAVLYPELDEPYRSVLGRIMQGIEQRARGQIVRMAITATANPQEIKALLQRQDLHSAIALGRAGLKLSAQLEPLGLSMVIGAVVTVPEADVRGLTVASLAPDPAALLARLVSFRPETRRVFIVYDPSQNRWMVRLAHIAATARGIELRAIEAGDQRSAMQHYQSILANMDAGKDALWLPLDTTTVNEATVLPLVLQEAWTRNLVVFSSNLAHVRRGALFSLYADDLAVGQHLAELVQQQLPTGNNKPGNVLPLKDALLAINARTAAHLGLDVARGQVGAQRVFPE